MPALKKKLSVNGSVKEYWCDYCESTTIHGLQYLGEQGRPKMERLWWLLVFSVSLLGSAWYIRKLWVRWDDSPVIVTFADRITPVWQVPFPAVTICSETKSKARAFDFGQVYTDGPQNGDEWMDLTDISLLCKPEIQVNGSRTTDESTVTNLYRMAALLNESLIICYWRENLKLCDTIFSPVLTEEGVCWTFNMQAAEDVFRSGGNIHSKLDSDYYFPQRPLSKSWSLEGGYEQDAPLETYPRRVTDAGVTAGLYAILLEEPMDFDTFCRGQVPGFKVLLHNPAEMPLIGEKYFRLPWEKEVLVAVTPKVVTTNDNLRAYSPEVRQCYFQSERYLEHFKIYTQQNCRLECLTNFTKDKCGCVAFHMPRNADEPICGSASKGCMLEAADELRQKNFERTSAQIVDPCNCLPPCHSLEYDASLSQAHFEWRQVILAFSDNLTQFDGCVMSKLFVAFKDKHFIEIRRREFIGVADFIAHCGGVLGLFSGVSLLSILEIVYYLTVKFCTKFNADKKSKSS